jgi:4-hydroxy-2-oxoheptanedioate aldolase
VRIATLWHSNSSKDFEMANSFVELLKTDEVIRTFAVARVLHPVVIEMFGLAGGYHGFWIDQEHASHSSEQLITVTLAGRANGFDSFVRMPPTGYWQVTQCLEAGAGGVMAAQIHSAEQAREFVSWTKFPPTGIRGLNASGRDSNYTHKPITQFVEDANRQSFVAIQIETLGALEQADEIAALDGVDLLFIGPSDLSMALGVVGQFHHEKLWEGIDRVAAACRNHGKAWGAVTPDPEFASRAIENGCRMPTMGNDMHVLRRGIEKFKESFGAQF